MNKIVKLPFEGKNTVKIMVTWKIIADPEIDLDTNRFRAVSVSSRVPTYLNHYNN